MKFARSGHSDIADNVPVINYSFVSRQTIINASLSPGAPLARPRHRRLSGRRELLSNDKYGVSP